MVIVPVTPGLDTVPPPEQWLVCDFVALLACGAEGECVGGRHPIDNGLEELIGEKAHCRGIHIGGAVGKEWMA